MATRHDRAILNCIFNPSFPTGECVYDDDMSIGLTDDEIITPAVQESKDLEVEGVKMAESGQLDKSIDIFTKAINIAPSRASAYNNRAQARRLKMDVEGAMEDLNNAINLSNGKGKAGRQAYCQRALIHKLQGNDEKAKQDFKISADLGSEFAKAQLVKMNPYAALCNQMLGEVISKLQKGEVVD